MNRFRKGLGFFHIEMASRAVTALDQLNHIIDATFSSIEQFEPFNRYTTLQSLYTSLDHQLEDDRLRSWVVGLEAANPYDLKGMCTAN